MKKIRNTKAILECETTLSAMRRNLNLSGERGIEIQRLQEILERAKKSSIYSVIRYKRKLKKPTKRSNG